MAQHRLGRVVTSSLLRRFEGTQLRPTVHRRFTPIVKYVAKTDTMGSVTIRVFLLDDHEMVRAGVRSLLESDEDIEVVGEASTVAEAMTRIPLATPDVAILDVRLEDGNGIEVCRDVRSAHPEIVCLMLTSFADDEAIYASVMAGVSRFLHLD